MTGTAVFESISEQKVAIVAEQLLSALVTEAGNPNTKVALYFSPANGFDEPEALLAVLSIGVILRLR